MTPLKKNVARYYGLFQAMRLTVLFVVHPADYQAIMDNITKWEPPKGFANVGPDTMMGIPVWKSPKIEQGAIRSYSSWRVAYNDLKDLLEPTDVDALRMRVNREVELASLHEPTED